MTDALVAAGFRPTRIKTGPGLPLWERGGRLHDRDTAARLASAERGRLLLARLVEAGVQLTIDEDGRLRAEGSWRRLRRELRAGRRDLRAALTVED